MEPPPKNCLTTVAFLKVQGRYTLPITEADPNYSLGSNEMGCILFGSVSRGSVEGVGQISFAPEYFEFLQSASPRIQAGQVQMTSFAAQQHKPVRSATPSFMRKFYEDLQVNALGVAKKLLPSLRDFPLWPEPPS